MHTNKKNILRVLLLILTLASCSTSKKTVQTAAPIITIPQEDLTPTWGLDISHYQQILDWSILKEQDLGFIFVKATEGSNLQDVKYIEYYNKI